MKRALAQEGPTVLVGHSYGGVVITEAGNDSRCRTRIHRLLPDAGQSASSPVQRRASRWGLRPG